MLETIVGCKWSLQILELIKRGVCRPGAIRRTVPGLTTKVQSGCLTRFVAFGILKRTVFPEIPPHVEYHLTGFGLRFVPLLDEIEALQHEIAGETAT